MLDYMHWAYAQPIGSQISELDGFRPQLVDGSSLTVDSKGVSAARRYHPSPINSQLFRRVVLAFAVLGLLTVNVGAQFFTLTGTNQPGTARDFPLALSAGTTNLSIQVGGALTTYSHLLLKAGAPPSDTNYDFLAAESGKANAINLEAPEFRLTNYVLRVRTPSNSLA